MPSSPVNMTAADATYGVVQTVSAVGVSGLGEQAIFDRLKNQIEDSRFAMQLRDSYYRGEQQISDLGISVPPALRWLKIPLGWPRVAIDAVDERLTVLGFRCGTDGAEDDLGLAEIWDANGLDSLQSAVHLDALTFGQGFVSVGSNPDPLGQPIVAVESPLDMSVMIDPRTRKITAALRVYGGSEATLATLYLANSTTHLSRTQSGAEWVIDSRDTHNLGVVPVVMFTNRLRSYDLRGSSDITPELMAVTDDAARTLQSMAVAREFYSAPQRYILGAKESDFVDAQGKPKSAIELYLGRFLALEADEQGHTPTVGQFDAHDPTTFTKVIDAYSRIVSAITGLPPHVLGFSTDNPASADAIRAGEHRIETRALRKAASFGDSWAEVMRLAIRVRDGEDSELSHQIRTVWKDTGTPTPMATAQAMTMIANSGIVPKESRVLLDRLGFDASEQELVAADRKRDAGEQFLRELASDIEASQIRTSAGLTKTKDEFEGGNGDSSSNATAAA